MTKCASCDKELLMVWPDVPWKCAFCRTDHPLCNGCYVDHTDEKHVEQLYSSVAKIRREMENERGEGKK